MKNRRSKNAYATKINRVCDYIAENLDEDLSVEKLSQVAHFSKYHFHRQFSEYCGISVSKYILMMRLKRASYQLAFNKQTPIIDIAMDARFENPESFSRAFKNAFGQTPSQFRSHPKWKPWDEKYQFQGFDKKVIERNPHMNIQIVMFEETNIAVFKHRGAPALVNDSVSTFIEWRKTSGLSPITSSRTFGLIYDDPKVTEPDEFRFDICGSVTEEIPENPQGITNNVIPGGKCATIRHEGPHDQMDDKVRYLYSEWLSNNDEELRDFPCFMHYINLFPDVSEHELITDIYLPLK